jgi:hypothetical protein
LRPKSKIDKTLSLYLANFFIRKVSPSNMSYQQHSFEPLLISPFCDIHSNAPLPSQYPSILNSILPNWHGLTSL